MPFNDSDWGVGVDSDIPLSPTTEDGQRVIDINNTNITTEIVRAGLNITKGYLGYHDGSVWKSYISSTGQFKFIGDANNYVEWDGNTMTVRGSLTADDVKTGLLQSSNWNTTAGSQFDLNNGVFKLGGSTDPKLSWDGSLLSVKGNFNILNPSSVRSDINVADGADVTSNNTSANTTNVGSKSATNVVNSVDKTDAGLNTSGEVIKPVKSSNLSVLTPTTAGLYMDSNKIGYHDGTSWTNYFSSDGFFRVGNSSNYIEYDPVADKTTFTGQISLAGLSVVTSAGYNTRLSTTSTGIATVGVSSFEIEYNVRPYNDTSSSTDYRFSSSQVSNLTFFGETTTLGGTTGYMSLGFLSTSSLDKFSDATIEVLIGDTVIGINTIYYGSSESNRFDDIVVAGVSFKLFTQNLTGVSFLIASNNTITGVDGVGRLKFRLSGSASGAVTPIFYNSLLFHHNS